MGNSCSFLTITHTTLSAKLLKRYRILTIAITAEFCFWAEQWLNRSSISGMGLAKTLDVPNTVLVKKLSQLFDGPLDGSKWLSICELP
jgi:hypothetical protein